MTALAALPDLGAYRRFVVAFSGGKDSLAACSTSSASACRHTRSSCITMMSMATA